jgi:hypothetical protein
LLTNWPFDAVVAPHPPFTPSRQLAEVALNEEPFRYDPRAAARASNPNRRRKWLIPLVLAAQVGLAAGPRRAMGQGAGEAGTRSLK